ncbi:hypothetical protein Dimus_017215 [Dionaea muscipula]
MNLHFSDPFVSPYPGSVLNLPPSLRVRSTIVTLFELGFRREVRIVFFISISEADLFSLWIFMILISGIWLFNLGFVSWILVDFMIFDDFLFDFVPLNFD